jgi:hypothetical protein
MDGCLFYSAHISTIFGLGYFLYLVGKIRSETCYGQKAVFIRVDFSINSAIPNFP